MNSIMLSNCDSFEAEKSDLSFYKKKKKLYITNKIHLHT